MRKFMLACALALPVLAQSTNGAPPTPRQAQTSASSMPVVTIARNGALKVNGSAVNISQLVASIQRRSGAERGVYLRPDKEVSWDLVSRVLANLGTANPPIPVNLITPDSSGQHR